MDSVMVAKRTEIVEVDGEASTVIRGRTYAHPDSEIVRDRPDMWREVQITYGPAADAAPGPPSKDVRAWARSEGIDVPDRGRLPADVVARYLKAQKEDR